MRYLFLTAILMLFVAGCNPPTPVPPPPVYTQPIYVNSSESTPYIGTIQVKLEHCPIRLLILKHCPDENGNIEGRKAIQAVNVAKSKGLTIEDVGNFHINKKGQTDAVWNDVVKPEDLAGLKEFISEQMKKNAQPGDTFIIYTVGHGGGDGSLMRLGQRKDLARIIAEAAAENEQNTLWWQMSCHAANSLPKMDSFSDTEQEYFSMIASSSAQDLSWFGREVAIMQKVFVIMATHEDEIDTDGDGTITAGELAKCLAKVDEPNRENLLWARSPDKIIFGYRLADQIPIFDGQNGQYPKGYIPRSHAPVPVD